MFFLYIDGLALNQSWITQGERVQQLCYILLLVTGKKPFFAGGEPFISCLLLFLVERGCFLESFPGAFRFGIDERCRFIIEKRSLQLALAQSFVASGELLLDQYALLLALDPLDLPQDLGIARIVRETFQMIEMAR